MVRPYVHELVHNTINDFKKHGRRNRRMLSSTGGAKPGEPSFRSDRDTLLRMGNQRTPVKDPLFGPGHFLRPTFI
jgi:hypothetical protein